MKYGNCPICQKERPLDPHHKKKRSQGGSNRKINIVYVCRDCHSDIHNCKGNWRAFTTKSFQKEGQTVEDYKNSLTPPQDEGMNEVTRMGKELG